MGYMNQQMNFPIAGIRTSVELVSYEALVAVLIGVDWEDWDTKFVSPHEYGATEYNDLTIISKYLKNHFNLTRAAGDIGYKGTPNQASGSLIFRLKRVNADSIYNIGEAMLEAGLLVNEDIQTILNKPFIGAIGKGDRRSWNGKIFRFYAKWYVTSALVEHDCKRREVAKKLGVKLKVITYWANLVVEDIRIQTGGK